MVIQSFRRWPESGRPEGPWQPQLPVLSRGRPHHDPWQRYFPGTALMWKLDSETPDSAFNLRIPAWESVTKLTFGHFKFGFPSGSASSCAERENTEHIWECEYSGGGEDARIPAGGTRFPNNRKVTDAQLEIEKPTAAGVSANSRSTHAPCV